MSRNLRKAEDAMLEALRGWEPAATRWPSFEQHWEWAQWLTAREPLVERKWGFVDGKNFWVEEPRDPTMQNAMYNRWLHNCFMTGTILFGADGCIAWVKHNCPRSWNDAETSQRMQERLLYPTISLQDHGVVADPAFPASNDLFNRFVTPLKEGDLERYPLREQGAILALSNAICSLRQAA
ncbi:hypothetical protein HK101_009292, partial [Irineochytrium annulatum]